MAFDDLRSPWREANGKAMPPEKREELVARVCRRVERLGATIVRRDWVETAAAVFVVFAFCGMFLRIDNLLAKGGAATVVVSACYIVYKIHRTRLESERLPFDASLRDFCGSEIERLDRQIHLLRTVLAWYISPILIGVNMVFVGLSGFGVASYAYGVFTLLLGWWIKWLNDRAVAKSLLPARDELAELLRELGEKP